MPVAIFGDIHGEADKLREAVNRIRAKYGDTDFYGVGDYIDRGRKSKEVIQICVDEGLQGILGNHELWFHKLLHKREFDEGALHPIMGGRQTLDSYGLGVRWPEKNVDKCVPKDHLDFILGLPLWRSVEVAGTTYYLMHAGFGESLGETIFEEFAEQVAQRGIMPDDDMLVEVLTRAVPDEVLWNHINVTKPQVFKLPGGGVQVLGHTPLKEPIDGGHFIALDTGCGRKKRTPLGDRGKARKFFENRNQLTAVVLLDDGSREFVSVSDEEVP